MVIDQIQVFAGDTWHKLPNMVFHVKKFNGFDPPSKLPGEPPKMEETVALSKRKREDAPRKETKMVARDAKHFLREHIVHVEL